MQLREGERGEIELDKTRGGKEGSGGGYNLEREGRWRWYNLKK